MKKYFYSEGNEKKGPFSFEKLKIEKINPDTLIWVEGFEDWTPVKEIKELEDILILIHPPVISDEKDNLNKSLSEEVRLDILNNKRDNSLLKNYPYMLLLSFVAGLIINRVDLPLNNADELVGRIFGSILIFTGIPLLIVRIVKWLSSNKHWNKKATKSAWIIQLILTFMSVYGSFIK